MKTDPAIAPDLPAKNEMKVLCTLTREQVTLYKAAVDTAFETVDGAKKADVDMRAPSSVCSPSPSRSAITRRSFSTSQVRFRDAPASSRG